MINLLFCLLTYYEEIPSGSLIFTEGGNVIVQEFTNSSITHVGIIIKENNDYYVYEAVRPKVRKILLNDYLKSIKDERIWIAKVKSNFNIDHEKMKSYLDSQLNKKYAIKNYQKKKVDDKTIFCSQLVVECYNQSASKKIFLSEAQYYAPIDVWNIFKNYSYIERYDSEKE